MSRRVADLATVTSAGAAALSFRLLRPLSPAFRARRLLALTLRDLRRLAAGHAAPDWEGRLYDRLLVLPNEATPLQRGQLLAALSVGCEIMRLRHIAHRLGLDRELRRALAGVAQGDIARATAQLARLDVVLRRDPAGCLAQTVLRARAAVLALSEALTRHAEYFDAGAAR